MGDLLCVIVFLLRPYSLRMTFIMCLPLWLKHVVETLINASAMNGSQSQFLCDVPYIINFYCWWREPVQGFYGRKHQMLFFQVLC